MTYSSLAEIEFDAAKDQINRQKHGLPLAIGCLVLENRVGDIRDPRDYGEIRRIAFGLVNNRLLACVYTVRNGVYRIISVRKANTREQNRWRP